MLYLLRASKWVLIFGIFSSFAWSVPPSADLTNDCSVNIEDLEILASQWLDMPGEQSNLDGVPGVNMADFAILASQWQVDCSDLTLKINEFMADNKNFYFDQNGDDDDWIEIYNYGSLPIDLGGMYLTDMVSGSVAYQIPTGQPDQTTIEAGGYIIIWADGEPTEGPLHASFKLSAGGGEDIAIYDTYGNLIDSIIDFGPQSENISYGRMPDAGFEWQYFDAGSVTPPTPNYANGGRLPEDEILITEIMYHPYNSEHPLMEDIGEEYIEIYNRGFSTVNLQGWQITDGVSFIFGDVSIGPKEYLAVVSDPAVFSAKYPGVSNYVGGWEGRLSNSGEKVELATADGKVVDSVSYADQGQWAVRMLGPVDYNHRGWLWSDEHDGLGKSLELISMSMPNEYAQNWSASIDMQGTPGAINSVVEVLSPADESQVEIAPLILDTKHNPKIPNSSDIVTVKTEILDEQMTGLTVNLRYRLDGQTAFETVVMAEYDTTNYGASKYSGQIPAFANGSVVEFYIEATDDSGKTRTLPAPVDVDGTLQQRCNALYQVDDSYSPTSQWQPEQQPEYRIIMKEAERYELDRIGASSSEANSNAQMNATFISVDGVDSKMVYNVGVRNRGHGTRTSRPNNYRVNFPSDNPWKNAVAINLNTQYTWLQIDATIQQTQQVADPLEYARKVIDNLRVTEIMYNPLGGSDLEYVELINIGTENLDIAGVRLDVGVDFTFPAMTLAPAEYVVVVNNAIAFTTQYGTGINIAGEFEGNLSNSGENLVLRLPEPLQAAVLRMEYNDTWYPLTDGSGYSLEIRDVNGNEALWNTAEGWDASANINGSPGTEN